MFGQLFQLFIRCRVYVANKRLPAWFISNQWRIQRRGPPSLPLFLDQTEARGAGKIFFQTVAPPPSLNWRSGSATGNYQLAYPTGRQNLRAWQTWRGYYYTCLFCRDVHLHYSVLMFYQNICFKEGEILRRIFSSVVIVSLFTQGVISIYIGKPEIPVGKSNGSGHSVWEASENTCMGFSLRR